MSNKAVLLIAFLFLWQPATAQDETKYRRSSIYSLMIKHDQQKFADDISKVFLEMPVPDKYNDHDLSVKVISVSDKKLKDKAGITDFLNRNQIASRLVGRWFDRDVLSGQCDMQLVKERGLYNANEFDLELANRSQRGIALLEDAGEDLIGNTFVLVNDIRYIDRSKGSATIGIILKIIGALGQGMHDAQEKKNSNNRNARYNKNTNQKSIQESFNDLAELAESYKGFKVKIHSYLYRLVWDDDIASTFYNDTYTDSNNDVARLNSFEQKGHLSVGIYW